MRLTSKSSLGTERSKYCEQDREKNEMQVLNAVVGWIHAWGKRLGMLS